MAVFGLSHPRSLTRIPDPIHEIVELTMFDRNVVDSKAFQRLHFVLQQSVSYVSFPANKNTRFPHSIGTAHLSARLFSNALSNSSTDDLQLFLTHAADFLIELIEHIYPGNGGLVPPPNPEEETPIEQRLMAAHQATISGASGFLHTPLVSASKFADQPDKMRIDTEDRVGTKQNLTASFVIDTYWQALRIYALTHDIGHLPMSHAFEMAVGRTVAGIEEYHPKESRHLHFGSLVADVRKDFSGLSGIPTEAKFFKLLKEMLGAEKSELERIIQGKALHEVRGFAILNNLLTSSTPIASNFLTLKSSIKYNINSYSNIINNLALCIIYSTTLVQTEGKKNEIDPRSFLFAIRQLVDGEVDGDRLDYTLRDCHEAGVRFGNFDLERIIRNAILVRKEANQSESDSNILFAIGYRPKAIAGIEQFFEARYQSYKYLVHHRSASRSNKVVETLIEKLFVYAELYPDTPCSEILNNYGYIALNQEKDKIERILPIVSDAIERIDDANLRTLLHAVKALFKYDGPPPKNFLNDNDLDWLPKERLKSHIEEEISVLSSIVLFRDLQHITTLFSAYNPDSLLREKLEIENPSERHAFMSHLEQDLGELFSKWRIKFRETSDRVVTLMYEHIKPKVFTNINPNVHPFERGVWVRQPQDSLLLIGDRWVSPGLNAMATERSSDRGVRVYAASRELKQDKNLMTELEDSLINVLENEFANFKTILAEDYQSHDTAS